MKKVLTKLLILLSTLSFSQELEEKIVGLWMEYSKAFEYKDYDKISEHFRYPVVFHHKSNPSILNNKSELIKAYKNSRETIIQKGYKYSLLEKWELIKISKTIVILDASYSRFNNSYEKIYSGRGLYSYEIKNGNWKMSAVKTIK